ncbi:MAG: hypothetical protein ACI9LM_003204 [Alteromonadaceae bacterium]|jgi:hypothetical protein
MFDDIRPYHDDEVVAVIQRLIEETDLQTSIASLKMPRLFKILPSLSRFLVKISLKTRAKKIVSTDAIQQEVEQYLNHLLKNSSTAFTYQGLDKLDNSKATLFISNHRDIILDAALVNLALFQSNMNTVQAAVGDNLLDKPWVSDLMRLNKCFVVKRSEKTKRAMLEASKQLSSFIHHSLTTDIENIWIAQREGRAKDGIDKTNVALISMLLLNKDKQKPIADYLQELNIVPVAISYEFDPCDKDKAIELAAKEVHGVYQKSADEDLKSMTQGLVGKKGQIHIEFCAPLQGDFADSKAIANEIDQQIIANYKLYDSNQTAYTLLQNKETQSAMAEQLKQRMDGLTTPQQHWLLTMYANPVFGKERLEKL